MDADRFRKVFLLLLVVAITALFFAMVRRFLMAVFLAAVFAGLAHPLYARLLGRLRGRRVAASLITMLLLILLVAVPLLGLLGLVASEALRVGESVRPWIAERLAEPGALDRLIESLPFREQLAPYTQTLLTKAGELVTGASGFVVDAVGAATRGTVSLLFQVFVLLYTMFFFLMDGGALLRKVLLYLPLDDADERRMLDKFTSVTRATLKGTLLIGIAQGALAGLAFWVADIPGALFWGTVMAALSIVPGVGTGLVWIPAALVLALSGHALKALFLALFCALVVGSVDNLLRPRLVGRDTRMPDLLIFFGTLGGLLLFGVLGFLVGPVIAALFVTVWDMYGVAFRDVLPAVGEGDREGPPSASDQHG